MGLDNFKISHFLNSRLQYQMTRAGMHPMKHSTLNEVSIPCDESADWSISFRSTNNHYRNITRFENDGTGLSLLI